jgi:chromosome segregation ATPase
LVHHEEVSVPEELDEIRQRLDALESRVNIEADLRAMMDRDQAWLTTRLDAQDRLLRALSTTQSEHTARFGRVEGRLSGVEGRLSGVEGRLSGVEGRLSRLEDGQQRLEDGQQRLENRQGSLEVAVGRVETGVQAILSLLSEDR